MRSEFIKSRTEISKYAYSIGICVLIIILNLLPIKSQIEITSDTILNPILSSLRGFGLDSKTLFTEMFRKTDLSGENFELKRRNAELEKYQTEIEELKKKVASLEALSNKQSLTENKYKVLKIRGVQNLYSSSPYIIVSMDSSSRLRVGDIIYYQDGYIFGMVKKIEGLSAEVLPYYSAELGFQIPAQSSKDPEQIGFLNPIENGVLKIRNVNKNAAVNIGDIWVTTNDRAEIPGSLILGKVKQVRENTETGFKELELELPFSTQDLEEVLVRIN